MTRTSIVAIALLALSSHSSSADDLATSRRQQAQEFDRRAQQRTGVLVPLYVYPANIHANAAYNRLIEIKRRFETVPMWVILNPASGPGAAVDANYTKAVDRLQGAGCVVLGYVTTSYGKRSPAAVRKDVDRWRELYPRVQGIFFDEMIYEDTAEAASHQAGLNGYAHEAGFWPTVGNPGADTPGRYFAVGAADTIVIHEGAAWPTEERLHGDYFGGYSDFPPFTRAALVHSQAAMDPAGIRLLRRYVRWVYVTEDLYRPGDLTADNPWDTLSTHLERLCEQLVEH